jgi:hypothetical protein
VIPALLSIPVPDGYIDLHLVSRRVYRLTSGINTGRKDRIYNEKVFSVHTSSIHPSIHPVWCSGWVVFHSGAITLEEGGPTLPTLYKEKEGFVNPSEVERKLSTKVHLSQSMDLLSAKCGTTIFTL